MQLFDYHIHTTRSGHAKGTMEQYVQAAIAAGLGEMGFSDHLPLCRPEPTPWTVPHEELDAYIHDVLDLRAKYPQIPIRLGVEVDYLPGHVQATRDKLASLELDYVIGSVHYLPAGAIQAATAGGDVARPDFEWCVDHPAQVEEFKRHQLDEVFTAYLRLLEQLAASGFCQIIGHADLPKKFGHRPTGDLREPYGRTAQAFARHGVIVELNTAGLRKPAGEIYPNLEFLRVLRAADVPITLGSDSHAPEEVGAAFAQAIQLARQAGYDTLHRWASPGRFAPVAI